MPNKTPRERAQICRTEAAWTLHPLTKALLLQMAEEYEAVASAAPGARETTPVWPTVRAAPQKKGRPRRTALKSWRSSQGGEVHVPLLTN